MQRARGQTEQRIRETASRRVNYYIPFLLLPLTIAGVRFARGQFTSSAAAPAVAPVSQAFIDGFMEGRRLMIANMGTGHSSISNPHASTGKGDLGDSSKALRDVAKFVQDNWDKADDSGRGKVAGEVETAVQYDQTYASQLSQNTGIVIPNHTTEAGYLSGPGRINGSKDHAVKLLMDTADQLDTLNLGTPDDPAKKTGVSGALANDDSHAAAFIPFYNAVHMGNRGKHEAEKGAIATKNQIASSVKAISENLASLVVPSSAPQP